jgi:hypothetical protein
MLMSFRVLAVLVLGCCLVSTVAALSGGCGYYSPPAGGWGAPSTDKYWGMSAEDIKNYDAAHPKSSSSSGTWVIPAIILPSYNGDKFASLSGYTSRFGDTQPRPGTSSSILNPDTITKPDLSGSSSTAINTKTDFGLQKVWL